MVDADDRVEKIMLTLRDGRLSDPQKIKTADEFKTSDTAYYDICFPDGYRRKPLSR